MPHPAPPLDWEDNLPPGNISLQATFLVFGGIMLQLAVGAMLIRQTAFHTRRHEAMDVGGRGELHADSNSNNKYSMKP